MAHISPISASTATPMSSSKLDTTQSDTPKFTYTTAGTIFNPDSVQPIQAPTRRSRAQKWGMPFAPSAELSFLPKSIIASLPMSSAHSRNNISANTGSAIPQYSPLQQNYDRAVSPVTPAQTPQSPSPADMGTLRMRSGNVLDPQAPAVFPESFVNHSKPVETTEVDHDDSDEDMSEDPISRLTVKSLHSLASYPNPNQQKAQKALRARPGARSVTSNGGNNTNSRSVTPSFGAFSFGSSDVDNGRSDSPIIFRSTQARHAGIRTFSSEGHQREVDLVRLPSNRPSNVDGTDCQGAEDVFAGNALYRSNLATGPGAPRPLTAGPPGQRQYKTANIDAAMRSLHNNAAPKFVVDDDDPAAVEFRALLQNANKMAATEMLCPADVMQVPPFPSGDPASPLRGLCDASVPEPSHVPPFGFKITKPSINTGFRATHAWDTKHFDEVEHYYPHGGPPFQNFSQLDPDWQEQYPLHPEWQYKGGTFQRPEAHVQHRNELVHRQFYAGASAFDKSVEQIAREEEQRRHRETVGIIGDRRPVRGQAMQEKLDIQEANKMSTSEAAKPFLTMILASMIDGMEETDKTTKQYAPFEQSARRLLASSSESVVEKST